MYMLFTVDAACSNDQRTQPDISSILSTTSSDQKRSNGRVPLLSLLTTLLTTNILIKTKAAKDTKNITRNFVGKCSGEWEGTCEASGEDSWTDTSCWTVVLNCTGCEVLTAVVLVVLPVTVGCGGVTVGSHISSKTSHDSPIRSAGLLHSSVTFCPVPSRNVRYTGYIPSQSQCQGLPATCAQQTVYKRHDISNGTLNTHNMCTTVGVEPSGGGPSTDRQGLGVYRPEGWH